MGNPLLVFWHLIFTPDQDLRDVPAGQATEQERRDAGSAARDATTTAPTTGPIFLVLRRMRLPLIVLILVFSLSVLGLTLIPGQQADGGTEPMSFFDAFYFMTYTATTIGFGEIPDPLTTDQRLWVTFSIYVAVIGWAYAIGTLLALLQDRGFRRALGTQRFSRQVRRIPEQFLMVLGYGEAGALVVRSLDARGVRLVVVDRAQDRIDALALEAVRADVPAISANVRDPATLVLAGLQHPRCTGVLALTDDDDANLAAVQAIHLLRPGLPVIARVDSAAAARRMRAFGEPTLVNPFDAFGDRLRMTLRTPTLAQLVLWLISPPGAPLPPRPEPPAEGAWAVVGSHRALDEVVADLHAAGLPVSALDPGGREGSGPEEQRFTELAISSVGLVAAAERDTLNISYVDAARRANPGIFVVARQESPANAPLFASLAPDLLLVPAEVVAREVLERLANPALWEFLQLAREQGDPWAQDVLDDLVARCGTASPRVWQVTVDEQQAPALVRRLDVDAVTAGDLLLSPFGRDQPLALRVLMLARGGQRVLLPDDATELQVGDVLVVAGGRGAQRAWDALLAEDEALSYVLSGQVVATSWWGRRVLGARR